MTLVSICSDGHDVLDQLAVGHKTFPCKLVSPHFCPFIYQKSEEATYFKNLLMLFTYFLRGSCKIHTWFEIAVALDFFFFLILTLKNIYKAQPGRFFYLLWSTIRIRISVCSSKSKWLDGSGLTPDTWKWRFFMVSKELKIEVWTI